MNKKKYITPQVGVQHIDCSTSILAGSPDSTVEKGWTTDPNGTTPPTQFKEEKPGDLPTEITGAKQWNAWDWGE